MTKVKTKKIVRKRFKLTKRGKVLHRGQGARHLRSKKNKRRQRRQDAPKAIVSMKFKRSIQRYMQT